MKLLSDAWLLASKDLRVYIRDRSALCVGFLVPIALVTLFGWIMTYAFGGSSGMPKVALWVVDEDDSVRSRSIVDSLRASEMLKVRPRVDEKPIGSEKLRAMVSDGEAHHGVVIPKGYGDANATDIDLKMIRDPGREMEDRMIQMALMQSLFTDSSGSAWQKSMKKLFQDRGMPGVQVERLESAMKNMQSTIQTYFDDEAARAPEAATESPSPRPANSTANPMDFMSNMVAMDTEDIKPPTRSKQVTYQQAQSVAGMTVMMLLFGVTGAGSILLAERDAGTLKRLFSLPVSRESVLLGKFLFVFVIGLAQMLVMFVYGELMFRVGLFRDPLALVAIVLTWTAAASSFGMFVATFSKSAKQADGLATILILSMAALGGCWFPLQMMSLPLPMEMATKSVMTYWAMDGMQGMLWNNLGLVDWKIQFALGVQWIWTIFLSGLSVFFFRRNYYAG